MLSLQNINYKICYGLLGVSIPTIENNKQFNTYPKVYFKQFKNLKVFFVYEDEK